MLSSILAFAGLVSSVYFTRFLFEVFDSVQEKVKSWYEWYGYAPPPQVWFEAFMDEEDQNGFTI